VAFREAVGAEALQLGKGALGEVALVAALDHAADQLVAEARHAAGFLEGRHGAAELVGLARGEPGAVDRDLHRLLLELVRRRVFASTDAAALEALSGWPGLRTVLAVESIRSVNNAPTKVESEIRYFLSSCPDSPAVLGQAIRSHWAVENALHWVLDVTFREDDSRVRDRTAARNLALLRKIALNIVGRDKTTKASVRARRKKAAWNDAYMLKLLVG